MFCKLNLHSCYTKIYCTYFVVHGTVDMHFSCCQGKPGAEGCTICYGHVHESNKYKDLSGYMKTFAKKSKDYCGVFSLDCEMVSNTYINIIFSLLLNHLLTFYDRFAPVLHSSIP